MNVKITAKAPLQDWYQPTSPEKSDEQIMQWLLAQLGNPGGFLRPTLADLPNPSLLLGMDESLDLFWKIYQEQGQILILGDYDVDGVTSTALLLRFFQRIGGVNVRTFIPNRFRHGYGLTGSATAEVIAIKPDLVITVDNGITAIQEIDELQAAGIQVIVTDHHEPKEGKTPNCVTINPKQKDCNFPDENLSGVGVAFMWVVALRAKLRELGFWQGKEPNLLEYLDLVALGTIADQVPMVGVNRILTRFGLEQMSRLLHSPNPGPGLYYLQAFGNSSNVKSFDSTVIGFRLGPLLNAAGRMQEASDALDFLMGQSLAQAEKALRHLSNLNEKRKKRQQSMYRTATGLAKEQAKNEQGLVVYDENFHEGLIGIIAHRLLDDFGLPTLVLTKGADGNLKASGRSANVDLLSLIASGEEFLKQWGGHQCAAGLTVAEENLEPFTKAFQNAASASQTEVGVQTVQADLEVKAEMLNNQLFDRLKELEPFGQQNQKPRFMIPNISLKDPMILSGKHLKWILDRDLEVIYWDGLYKIPEGSKFNLVGNLGQNQFRGQVTRQFIITAIEVLG